MKIILWVVGIATTAVTVFAIWANTEAGNAKRAEDKATELQIEINQLETAKSAAETRNEELKLARQLLDISMEQRKKENDRISAELSQARSEIRRITNALPEPQRACALNPIPSDYIRLLDSAAPNDSGDGDRADMPPADPNGPDEGTAAPAGR